MFGKTRIFNEYTRHIEDKMGWGEYLDFQNAYEAEIKAIESPLKEKVSDLEHELLSYETTEEEYKAALDDTYNQLKDLQKLLLTQKFTQKKRDEFYTKINEIMKSLEQF